MIINAINGNGNRLIRVNKDTNKDAVKEFLVTTLSQCDTNSVKRTSKYRGQSGQQPPTPIHAE